MKCFISIPLEHPHALQDHKSKDGILAVSVSSAAFLGSGLGSCNLDAEKAGKVVRARKRRLHLLKPVTHD